MQVFRVRLGDVFTFLTISVVFELDDKFIYKKIPCFTQADLLVRSLISDPEVGYVPKFIIFLPTNVYVKARALFMDPSFLPPPKLVENFPTGCGAANCTDDDCGAFDLTASRAFAKDSALLRRHEWEMDVVRCNLWTCDEKEPADISGKSLFHACKKCREAFYCCKDHQVSVRLSAMTLLFTELVVAYRLDHP